MYYFVSLVDCGPPASPINGYLGNYSSTKEGTNVTFQCNEGYVPTIVRISTCNRYGVWHPAPHEHNCTLTEGNIDDNCKYSYQVDCPQHW